MRKSVKEVNGVTIEIEGDYCYVYDDNFEYYDGKCVDNCTHEDIYNSLKDYIECN